MKASRFNEERIIAVLREHEAGAKTAEVCRRHGISDATFYIYGRLPRGRKVLGPGLTRIDCKHLFGVTSLLWALDLNSQSDLGRRPSTVKEILQCSSARLQPLHRVRCPSAF